MPDWKALVRARVAPLSGLDAAREADIVDNVAIFSVVRAVVLKPPPYRDPSRVVAFLNSRSGTTLSVSSSSIPDYEDWTRQLTSFESMGLLSGWTFNITSLELPERVFG